MKRKIMVCCLTLALGLLFLSACGAPAATTTAPASGNTTSPTQPVAQPQTLSPKDLGDRIGAVYVEALQEVTKLIENKPAAAEAKPKVAALKEKYIQQLVALGKLREALSTADKATVDNGISLALNRIGSAAWYTTYNQVTQTYRSADLEFANLVSSFNIIGQYANFDLLKQQAPDEAKRLGIN